ncbi:MAG: AAA family ATPase, partial [Selenomonadaceae bacterium]|nr:AAA family ATPase [Selenomonadaceae bacterium]
MDLFSNVNDDKKYRPLAERMRPQTLSDFAGQEKILRGALGKMIAEGQTPSLIFFGAPGTGKTTLAKIIANTTQSNFVKVNAALSGVSELRALVKEAEEQRKFYRR